MIISVLDMIYIVLFSVGFCYLFIMESQIKSIKTMMEEHVKFDKKMCDQERLKNTKKK